MIDDTVIHKLARQYLRYTDGDSEVYGTINFARAIEQAARIQQQALEYVSLQAQCDEHLARIAELEKERDALRADAERWREF